MSSITMSDMLAVRKLGPNKYETTVLASEVVGARMRIGYGGHTIAIGVKAAGSTVAPNYHIYSISGNFLGPSRNDRKLVAEVKVLRDTRTFQTRFVELSQVQDDGSERLCMSLLVDFHVKESPSLLEYSAQPSLKYSPPDQCPTAQECVNTLLEQGRIEQRESDLFRGGLNFFNDFFEQRECPESVFSPQLLGLSSIFPNNQSDRAIADKRSAVWFRNTRPLTSIDQAASLAFLMDSCMPIVSHVHAGLTVRDIGQASSLDFSLRVMVSDLCLDDWHLREWAAVAGGEGRTYSDSRVWDQKGRLVCCMTQQCILRSKKPKPSL